ncbi:hypothetical protein IW261DRAFT_1485508, partial [Armillaria novae-zelandiae]
MVVIVKVIGRSSIFIYAPWLFVVVLDRHGARLVDRTGHRTSPRLAAVVVVVVLGPSTRICQYAHSPRVIQRVPYSGTGWTIIYD